MMSMIIHCSPAYAGIDTAQYGRYTAPQEFPRIRGDRPHPDRGPPGRAAVPPHTRG